MRRRKYSVLIVDDEEYICDLLDIMLTNFDIFSSVIVSNSAQDATQKVINQEFDLIIIDNKMPRKDGLDWIRQFSLHPHVKCSRIIFMSGVMDDRTVLTAVRYGIKNFLVKPFTRKKLQEIVTKVLKL